MYHFMRKPGKTALELYCITGLSSYLSCEDAGRQRDGSHQETVDLTEDGGIYRRQQKVQTPRHVDATQNTWNTFMNKDAEF